MKRSKSSGKTERRLKPCAEHPRRKQPKPNRERLPVTMTLSPSVVAKLQEQAERDAAVISRIVDRILLKHYGLESAA